MEIKQRNKWIGILIGAGLIAAGSYIGLYNMGLFFINNSIYFHAVFSLIGGLIVGMLSSGNIKDGIKSGSICGLVGSVIIVVPFIWQLVYTLLIGTTDEMAGMIIFLGFALAVVAIVFASLGAIIGTMCRRTLFGDGK